MRYWLLTFSLILACFAYGQAPQPFPDGPPITFTFTETYKDEVEPDPDFPDEFIIVPHSTLNIAGQAPMTAEAIATIDADSTYSISIGDFEQSGLLNEDPTFAPEEGD